MSRHNAFVFATATALAVSGPCNGECPEDLDGDGTIGFSDLLIVLGNWTG